MVTKISLEKSHEEVLQIAKEIKISKRKNYKSEFTLGIYVAEILTWAKIEGVSKEILVRLIWKHLKIRISKDQIYSFVKRHNNGTWPNGKLKNRSQND